MLNIVDMHLHTRLSDGFNNPKELLEEICKTRNALLKNGNELVTVGITDHDTLLGGELCLRLNRENQSCNGLNIVPGVELDLYFMDYTIHMLIYLCGDIEKHSTAIKNYLVPICDRISRAMDAVTTDEMVRRINSCPNIKLTPKKKITPEIVRKKIETESSYPDALFNSYIASKWSDIGELMIEYGYVKDWAEMRKHLGIGGCCKCEDYKVKLPYTVESFFELIKPVKAKLNCQIFLAHPGAYISTLVKKSGTGNIEQVKTFCKNNILQWAKMGMDGIEVYSSHHEKDSSEYINGITEELLGFAKTNKLAITGGSDYHGAGKPEKIALGLGSLKIPADIIKTWNNQQE